MNTTNAASPADETVPSPATVRTMVNTALPQGTDFASQRLYHTFEDGVQMFVGGDLHRTGARFANADGSPAQDMRSRYSGWEAELKAAGKTMTPLLDEVVTNVIDNESFDVITGADVIKDADQLTAVVASNVDPALRPRLIAVSVALVAGDVQEQFAFVVTRLPEAVPIDNGDGTQRIEFETDRLLWSSGLKTIDNEPSTILQAMGDYKARMNVKVYGPVPEVLGQTNLDATEPYITAVRNGANEDVTNTPEGQAIVDLFRFSHVTHTLTGLVGPNEELPAEVPEPAPKKVKLALCIPAWQRFVPRHEWTPTLEDRATCETDLSKVQIIPYITVQDGDGNLFCYTRGTQGDEKGLHEMRSMGGGGHMDQPLVVAEGQDPGEALDELIISEGIREIQEEYGYDVPYADMKRALKESFPIYRPENDVDRVHLGLSLTVTVPDRRLLTKLEDGVIEKPIWMDRAYANLQMHVSGMMKPEAMAWQFETWTKVYLQATVSPEVKQSYLKQLSYVQWTFYRQNHLLNLLIKEVGDGADLPQFRQQADHQGLSMRVSLAGDGEFVRFDTPLEGLIDMVKVEWVSGGDGFIPKPVLFQLASSIEGKAVQTSDFLTWEPLDIAVFAKEMPAPEAAPAEEVAADAVTPVYGKAE